VGVVILELLKGMGSRRRLVTCHVLREQPT
jgi:hypothetical protein